MTEDAPGVPGNVVSCIVPSHAPQVQHLPTVTIVTNRAIIPKNVGIDPNPQPELLTAPITRLTDMTVQCQELQNQVRNFSSGHTPILPRC